MEERGDVAASLGDRKTATALRAVVRPNSPTKALKRLGTALILAPDPATGVVGIAMLGASFALKKRDPIGASSVYAEAKRLIDEIGSI